MASGNLAACLKVTLKHEGGWADHPKDPGGATMKGITLATFRRYRKDATKTELRNISDADVQTIYRDGYWSKVRGDLLPFGVDLATFDYGVNSGPSRAIKDLQRAVGAKADGEIGAGTRQKIGATGPKIAIQMLCARRMGFVRALKTWGTFGKGWSRRIAEVEAKAVAMWLASGGKLQVWQAEEMKDDADHADTTAGNQNKAAGGVAAGGGGGAVMAGDINWMVVAVVGVIVILGVVAIVAKARHNRERAAAYRAVAAEG